MKIHLPVILMSPEILRLDLNGRALEFRTVVSRCQEVFSSFKYEKRPRLNLLIYIYICMYVYICVCVCIYIYMYGCVCVLVINLFNIHDHTCTTMRQCNTKKKKEADWMCLARVKDLKVTVTARGITAL